MAFDFGLQFIGDIAGMQWAVRLVNVVIRPIPPDSHSEPRRPE